MRGKEGAFCEKSLYTKQGRIVKIKARLLIKKQSRERGEEKTLKGSGDDNRSDFGFLSAWEPDRKDGAEQKFTERNLKSGLSAGKKERFPGEEEVS